MKYIWIIKLKLKDEFREKIEEYFLSLNASISSIDSESNSNTLTPKIFYTHVFLHINLSNYVIFYKKHNDFLNCSP